MASRSLNFMVLMGIMVASMQFFDTMAQTMHVVGDALGWTIPSNGATAYTVWASRRTFNVGDTLIFNFTNGLHDVAEVTETAYGPCTSANPISLTTTGPASLTLTTPGTHYYICTFASHCQIGQKLTINVSATGTTTPPSLTPTSPPTTSPTPTLQTPLTPSLPCPPTASPSSNPFSPPTTTSGSITPAPPPSSGASSLTTVLPAAITFLTIGSAFFNY